MSLDQATDNGGVSENDPDKGGASARDRFNKHTQEVARLQKIRDGYNAPTLFVCFATLFDATIYMIVVGAFGMPPQRWSPAFPVGMILGIFFWCLFGGLVITQQKMYPQTVAFELLVLFAAFTDTAFGYEKSVLANAFFLVCAGLCLFMVLYTLAVMLRDWIRARQATQSRTMHLS